MAETLNFLPQETQHPAFNAIESRMSALGDGGAADFSGITREAPLFIGDAVQKANITVDEKGTEAAATALDFPVSGPPPLKELTANRPFLFAILERETGTVLFLGRVTDPS
jgi:serine protease inhibitor